MGNIDGDALLALGPQTVGQQGEVRGAVAIAATGLLHRLQLVLEHRLGVVEQAADEGALAVVHRASGGDAQCAGGTGTYVDDHQKYPSRLRSSMADSLKVSSARVAPRSVIRAAATSTSTSSTPAAVDSTAPVQLASPTVR
ncbi:unannotated protein [freshwater metagenome]|uniref:Unannotated protein n=1 Tax=freshwater metagenome TaxID=449393 RepID=A0A6J6VT32_9ZZZZ